MYLLFNIHHKDWLTCSDGTNTLCELGFDFCISNNFTQIVNCFTYCDSFSPDLLDFSLTLVIVLQWLPFHCKILILLSQFPMSPFHCMADDYFCGDWDSLHDHLRDIFW